MVREEILACNLVCKGNRQVSISHDKVQQTNILGSLETPGLSKSSKNILIFSESDFVHLRYSERFDPADNEYMYIIVKVLKSNPGNKPFFSVFHCISPVGTINTLIS